jgi:aminomethyltransferase
MSEATGEVLHTPLEAEHRALGARLGPFAGWLMPIEYAGTLKEHQAVRQDVGVFDLTHLGKIFVEGPGAIGLLQRALSNDLSKVEVGAAQYNTVLNDRGGIVDDLIAYRLEEQRWLVAPNAANTGAVHEVLLASGADGVDIESRPDLVLLAVQGPRSFEVVGERFPESRSLDYMHVAEAGEGDAQAIVARSGYTGERGFELIVPESRAVELWRDLLAAGVHPIGLGARDTLRLEMGYPLHGNDISPDRSPLEAGLSWAVSFTKGEFRGRDSLERQKERGIPDRLWGLRMKDRLIPRPHYPVLVGDEPVGETTSGTFSPTLKVGIAMAYLAPRERFSPGDPVEVDIRGRRGAAEVVKPPFVDRSPK